MKKGLRLLLLSGLLLLFGGTAVGLTDIGKVCLFSAMSGVITQDGKPVANARLVRTARLDSEVKDETTTDENGYFSFPAMYTRTVIRNFLPMELIIRQRIYAHHKGKEYNFWSGVKDKKEENTESRGKPLVVSCELNSELIPIWVDGTVFSTMCNWDVEPDPPFDHSKIFDSDLE